jgi:hypothetical protein
MVRRRESYLNIHRSLPAKSMTAMVDKRVGGKGDMEEDTMRDMNGW